MNTDVIVIDAGGTKTRLGALRGSAPMAAFSTLDSRDLDGDAPHLVLAAAVREFVRQNQLRPTRLVVGVPGMLDERREEISQCNNVPALEGRALFEGLRDELQLPVLFEQDIMLQLLGEWRNGVAQGRDSVFGLYFGTGIGSAWLQDGDPFQPRATCQQAGHIPMAMDGLKCKCGKADCVEAYSSGHTLHALSRQHGVPIDALFEHRGNADLERSLERFVVRQGYLVTTIGMLLEPAMIVIGGGIPSMPGYPRERLVNIVADQLQASSAFDADRLGFAVLAEQAPLFGAEVLVNLSQARAFEDGQNLLVRA